MCFISKGAARNESQTPHLSLPQQKKASLSASERLIPAQPPPVPVVDKRGTAVSQARALEKVEFPGWRGLQHPKGTAGWGVGVVVGGKGRSVGRN